MVVPSIHIFLPQPHAFCRFAVTFTNGTKRMLQYQLPSPDKRKAAAASAAAGAGSPAGPSACCKPLAGKVASFSSGFAMFSSSSCAAADKVCSFSAAVMSVWVCGCPGGKCYGEPCIKCLKMKGVTQQSLAVPCCMTVL